MKSVWSFYLVFYSPGARRPQSTRFMRSIRLVNYDGLF